MPQPLVLRFGRIAEETPAEAGVYPRLRSEAGRLFAGGPGLDLIFVGGRISQLAPAVDGMWDGGTTTWDGGSTTWDAVSSGGMWDDGTTTWDGGATAWDDIATAPATWDDGATTWDGGSTTWDAAGPVAWDDGATVWDGGTTVWN